VDRHCRCSPACRSWTVYPSRKLRRFESFTCHPVLPCRPAVIGSHRPSMAVREEYVRTRSVSTARPAATTFAHRRAKLRQRAALRQPWSVPTQPRCVSDSNWPCACLQDLGHQRPRAFGSKFRAITRAITHGQLGVITVSRGRSRERTPVPQTYKRAGHRLMTCRYSGGQGRGRTADLPIFSRRFGTGTGQWSRPVALCRFAAPWPHPPSHSSDRTSLVADAI
jgi:hypothetical protein